MTRHVDREPASARVRTTKQRTYAVIIIVMALALLIGCGSLAVRHLRGLPWQSLIQSSIGGESSVMSSHETARLYPREASPVDFNSNGTDDYADIVVGARADAQRHPTYDSGYYDGGYPPDDRGACTDVVWRAFREAGYDLKAMVDADIAAYPDRYATVAPNPDPNIDFRRTGVLDVFFATYGQTLTTDISDYAQWQGGDIVVFETSRHIGIISDKRDGQGITYVIHNMGQRQRENDYLAFAKHMKVTGHYRFDASTVPGNVLKAWLY